MEPYSVSVFAIPKDLWAAAGRSRSWKAVCRSAGGRWRSDVTIRANGQVCREQPGASPICITWPSPRAGKRSRARQKVRELGEGADLAVGRAGQTLAALAVA